MKSLFMLIAIVSLSIAQLHHPNSWDYSQDTMRIDSANVRSLTSQSVKTSKLYADTSSALVFRGTTGNWKVGIRLNSTLGDSCLRIYDPATATFLKIYQNNNNAVIDVGNNRTRITSGTTGPSYFLDSVHVPLPFSTDSGLSAAPTSWVKTLTKNLPPPDSVRRSGSSYLSDTTGKSAHSVYSDTAKMSAYSARADSARATHLADTSKVSHKADTTGKSAHSVYSDTATYARNGGSTYTIRHILKANDTTGAIDTSSMTSIKTIGYGSSTNVNDSLRVHYNGFFDANIYNTYTPNFANRVELHGPAQFDSITVITAHSTRDSSTKVPNTAWALHAIDSIAPQIIAGTGITSIKTGSSYTISLYQAPYIASLTNTTPTNYLGQTVTSVTVNWTLGGPAITNQTLTGASLILTDRTHTFSGTWTNDASWTLSITDGITPSSANTGITFYVQKFYGTTSDAVPTAADIHTGSSSWQTQSSGNRGLGSTSITGGGNYIFYAYPASWGYVSIAVNGFGSTWNTTTVSVTNAYGNIQNYTVYTSPTTIVGTVTISASGI